MISKLKIKEMYAHTKRKFKLKVGFQHRLNYLGKKPKQFMFIPPRLGSGLVKDVKIYDVSEET